MSITEDTLLPAQAARAAIRADLEVIDAAYARIRAADTDLVGNAFRVEVAEHLETQDRVNRGLSYRFFAEIADPPDGPPGPEDPVLPAGTKTIDVLWTRLRCNRRDLNRRFRLAARIRPRRSLTGPPLPAPLTQVGEAVESGTIGPAHIVAITTVLDHLPAATSPTDRDRIEHTLVVAAREHDPDFVATLGQAIIDALITADDFTDEDRARRRSLVLGRQGPDGMSRLTGWVDPETRAYLEVVIAAVRPGHHQPDPTDPASPASPDSPASPASPPAPDTRRAEQRAHDGLKLGLRHGIESAKLGTHRGVPVTVIATTKLDDLDQAIRALDDPDIPMPPAAYTGGGSRLSYRDLIAMAAGSIHYLAIFDNHSDRPLYLARSQRIATLDQRLICYARDHGCTRPNCTQPGYHCEVHHATDWAKGGQTNADELYFACQHDHTGATAGHYTTTITNHYRLAWTDGTTPPRVNHLHHPDELLTTDHGP